MHIVVLALFVIPVSCLENENYDYISNGVIIANIKRRDTIPLQPNNRRWLNNNNLSYRKTMDIRKNVVDRRFEITETQVRNAQREAQFKNLAINEINEDNTKSIHTRDQIRNGMQVRDSAMRNVDMRDDQFQQNFNQRNNKYDDSKDHQEMLREMRWINVDNGD